IATQPVVTGAVFVVVTCGVNLMLDIGAVELRKCGAACRTVVVIPRRTPSLVFLISKRAPLQTPGKIQAPLKPLGHSRRNPLLLLLHHNSTALLESKHSHLSNRPDVIERPELACVSSAQNGSKSTGHFITACWPMALTRPWLR